MSELAKALIGFHQDVDTIEKNARANYGKFADLANVLSTVTPALLKNNLVVTQTFLANSLITTLRHVSGEEISSVCDLVLSEGRNKTQEWGKAVTYQRRYSIVSLLGLVADMDMDGAMLEEPAKVEAPPKKTVKKKAVAAPSPTPAPAPSAYDQPLNAEEKQGIVDELKKLFTTDKNRFTTIQSTFFKTFPDLSDLPLSQAITTHAHSEMILAQILNESN
jgi:hypothetical protein